MTTDSVDINALYSEIGRRIQSHRSQRGITQADLAQRVSLTRTSITNIEGGKQSILVHTVYAIASALEVELSDLLPMSTPRTFAPSTVKSLEHYSEDVREFVEGSIRGDN